MKFQLLVAALFAATDLRAQVAIPRFHGATAADAARDPGGMRYDPSDVPLRWLPDGELILVHLELYNYADVYASTCEGSGIFVVQTSGRGKAKALAIGQPDCHAAQSTEGVAIDPLGRTLVYAVLVKPNNSRLVQLDLLNWREDTLQAGCAIYHEHPAFSADGRRIATDGMCQTREGNYEIYLMNADGSGLHRIGGADTASHQTPAWSAEGARLVYVRHAGPVERPINQIVVVDSAGLHPRAIARGVSPAWSPTGEWIAFLADGPHDADIRLIRPDGTDERVVFHNSVTSTYSRGWGLMYEGRIWGALVWSPNGKELAFVRAFDRGSTIWIVNVANGAVRQLTSPGK